MANPQDLRVKLTVDASGVNSGINEATAKLKSFGGAAQSANGPLSSLGDTLKKGLGFAGIAVGATAVIGFLKESSQAAVDDQKSMALLARQITTTTGATKEQLGAIEGQIGALEELSGVADDKIRPSFSALVRATGDTTNAMQLQKVALDLSAGAHIPLETAAKALGKAYNGNTAALTRLVPSVKGAKDPIDAVAKSMAGAAKTAADNDPYSRLGVAMDHIKETLGKALLPILGSFASILKTLLPVINLLSGLIGMLVKAIMPLISHLVTALMPAFNAVVRVVMAIVSAALPPLVKILDKVLVPIISFLANMILKYFVPAFEAMYQKFGNIASVIANVVVKSFQLLIKILGPIYKTVIEPLLNGLMSLLGIKPVTIKVSTDTTDFKMPSLDTGSLAGFTGAGAGGAGAKAGAGSSTAKKADTALVSYIKNTQKLILDARKTYDDAVAAANDKYGTLIKKYSDEMQTIIQTSMDRLRNAFASATATDVGKMFSDLNKDGTASADQLLDSLKTRLTSIKTLAANAATLAGLGFSQTFIEQVVALGPDAGNAMADALKAASPETRTALQKTFGEAETVSNTGMDSLATTLYKKAGLATAALKTQYDAAAVNMKQAQDDLATTLKASADALNTSLMKISDDFTAYLLKTKTSLTKHAGEIAAIRNSLGTGYAATTTSPYSGMTADAADAWSRHAAASTTSTTSVTVHAQTDASPQAIGDAVAFAIRNGSPYTYNMAAV